MTEKCWICGKKMYIGEAYSLLSQDGRIVAYVHRSCLDKKAYENPKPKGDVE